jgi:transposase
MSKISRLEVVSTGARRRWTLEEKQRIVAESFGGPRLVSATARRNGLSTSQLFTWRRLARTGRLSGDAVPALVAVEIASTAAPASRCAPVSSCSSPQRAGAGIIEIELGNGCRVRVDREVDGEARQSDYGHHRLLRPCRKWPRGCATQSVEEIPSLHARSLALDEAS